MTKLDYEAIIRLSEDPEVNLENVRGEKASPGDYEKVAELADAIFCQSPIETQIRVLRGWPTQIAARRLALVPEQQREDILSCLPSDLAQEIASQLPVATA